MEAARRKLVRRWTWCNLWMLKGCLHMYLCLGCLCWMANWWSSKRLVSNSVDLQAVHADTQTLYSHYHLVRLWSRAESRSSNRNQRLLSIGQSVATRVLSTMVQDWSQLCKEISQLSRHPYAASRSLGESDLVHLQQQQQHQSHLTNGRLGWKRGLCTNPRLCIQI